MQHENQSKKTKVNPPLVAHIVYRFDYGGLENGLVNLINTMPADAASHVIISLTEPGEIVQRISRKDVSIHCLDKRRGKDPAAYFRLFRLLRRLRPDVVHTRNFGTLDCQFVASMAGAPLRYHGEHGWDIHDPDGTVRKYHYLRRAISPLVNKFIVLSEELQHWLIDVVEIPETKIVRICNGVDTARFQPKPAQPSKEGYFTFGSVTRFSDIKDPLNTIKAFIELRSQYQNDAVPLKLLMVGDGPLLKEARKLIVEAEMDEHICLAGSQIDVSSWLEKMDVFVMGSKREGISNTILEAMAAGKPVIATNAGGNSELIENGKTGAIVAPDSPSEIARVMLAYLQDSAVVAEHGAAARERAVNLFSLKNMVEGYTHLYHPGYLAEES